MGQEIPVPQGYKPWGPFVERYQVQSITRIDLIVASTAFALANSFGLSAAYIAVRQTRACRRPWRSGYIWMIWLEWFASIAISIECLLYVLRVIRPSFLFFFSLLLWWAIQTQLLLQIIINRIRIILHDKSRGRQLVIGTAILVTLINISVFCVWMPARLQINNHWIRINSIWDRTEKVLYLCIDASLNYYFIRAVKADLIRNGLQKYNRLVRFNQRIIVISLLMDVMIIGAMSVPNGLVYAMFHPLAYLVKLNIELSMAHLIKVIAFENHRDSSNMSFFQPLDSSPDAMRLWSSSPFGETQQRRTSLLRGLFGLESETSDHTIRQPEQVHVRDTLKLEFDLTPVRRGLDETPNPMEIRPVADNGIASRRMLLLRELD